MERFLLISIGAVFGANLRYWISDLVNQRWQNDFPMGTFMVNLVGCFILSFFMTLTADRFIIDPRLRLFFTVGFLGAFTTFSTYSFESINLISNGQLGLGLINLFGSAVLGGLVAVLAVYLAKLI
ncbi:MAG: fluoride efflux transporter CrcB [Anaerolineaceae bacterium]|nr:fluoride efflux transporter CrcB [Anaerolineaceae bacterium]